MPPEPLLIERAQRGCQPSFRQLVQRHQRQVYALAFDLTGAHHDAEDVAQEALVRAWQKLATFRGDASFGTWLHRVTVSCFLNSRRARRHTQEVVREDWTALHTPAFRTPDVRYDPTAGLEAAEVRTLVKAALDTLSPTQRSVFVLRHWHGHTTREVAETLDVSESSVRVHLHRAVHALRERLAFYQQPELEGR